MFKFKECEPDDKPELIIVPMVDLMLFLLAFFVLIAGSIIPGLAVKTNPPETRSKASLEAKRKVLGIVITKSGDIYYGKEKLNFETLVRLLRSFKKQYPYLTVVVDADRRAPVQSLVNVLDATQKVGINSVGLLAKEKKGGSSR